MQTNFYFLENEWPEFYDRAHRAEKLVRSDPRGSLAYARMALELAVSWMYANDEELETPFDNSINSLILTPEFKAQFNHKMYNELHLIRKTGNFAIHNKKVSEYDSSQIIEHLFYFSKWFAKSYTKEDLGTLDIFDWNLIPAKGSETQNKKKVKELHLEMQSQLQKFQEKEKSLQEEREKLREENELFKRRFEEQQAEFEANKKEANTADEVTHPRNEYETRKHFIDVALREAGWELNGANDKEYKVQFMPKSTNVSETGYVDYVLWDDDGTPLALVEAKKTLENASKGENQAQLYADCLEKMHGRRPVMYYSNGFETYLWDDQFYKQSRLVHGFYTKSELQTLMFRRENRKDIRKTPIDTDIAGRNYQMRSIKSIAEHFAGKDKNTGQLIGTNRGALLVLATGTGKTRTSIAFSKMMLQANWAKRILFLADRISLVKQAKSNFVKLLPEHASVNLLEEKDNPDARIAFSTYQTMMGLIDNNRHGENRYYGVGHFDLIIVDEAHRSIYQKYQAIFDYFDALFLGLTATPKESIDKNTYSIFGLPDKTPTDAYTFDEAVNEDYLVPYHTIELPTKFHTEGIHYEDLSPEEKEAFEEEILDGEEASGSEWIPAAELNKWLFNKDTALKTLRYVLENGVKKRGGDELGKTIIFAKNQKHAHFLKDMFMELDKTLFGNDYVKVITHSEPKSQEFIERFCDEEKERLPQIAISVDMMDTGIDAPSCVNLVFYKPVKSYAKFWQMIGRGSRLREDLFGPGEDKTHFLIFDLFGNFEFFKENPNGIETTAQKGLTELVFGLKLDLAEYLKMEGLSDNEELQQFKNQLLDELHKTVSSLDKNRFDVKMKIKTVMDYGTKNRSVWDHLSKKDVKEIKDVIAPLIRPEKGDSDLSRFYDKLLYTLMIKRLETPNAPEFKEKLLIPITKVVRTSKKLLKKSSIPVIKENEELIKEPLEERFWEKDGVKHLEKIRAGVRELVKYIDPEDQRYVTTDFEDTIDESKVKTTTKTKEPDSNSGYKSPFKSTVDRLEQLLKQNKDNVTINRIRKGEKITKEELRSLESVLFSEKLQREQIEKELGERLDLVKFIIALMGLSKEKVDQAFADFINKYELSSVQIKFLNTIKLFLTENGKLDATKLYDDPFKKYHTMGVDGVFNESQADELFQIIGEVNELGEGA